MGEIRERARTLLAAYRDRLGHDEAVALAAKQVNVPIAGFRINKLSRPYLRRFIDEAEFQIRVWFRRDKRRARLERKRHERETARIKNRKFNSARD